MAPTRAFKLHLIEIKRDYNSKLLEGSFQALSLNNLSVGSCLMSYLLQTRRPASPQLRLAKMIGVAEISFVITEAAFPNSGLV